MRVLLIALLLALSVGSADARHRHYRFHFGREAPQVAPFAEPAPLRPGREDLREGLRGRSVELAPPDWQLQAPDANWAGRRYVSPDGAAWLAVYTSEAEQPLAAHLKTVAFADGEEPTFLQGTREGLVVAGVKGDRMFFRKVRLGCAGKRWQHVALEFPASEQRRYQPLVAHVSRSLEFAGDCTAAVAGNARQPE